MAKANQALSARRTEEILRIRINGAEFWDVVEFVREKEREEGAAWHVPEGDKPLSEGMIRKYQERADALIMESHEKSRKKLLRRHLAQRRNLYARALADDEIRTALACLDSEAALLGLHLTLPKPPVPGPQKDKKQYVAEAVAFYSAIIRSRVPLADRMRAQEGLNRLLGLDNMDLLARLEALEARLAESDGGSKS